MLIKNSNSNSNTTRLLIGFVIIIIAYLIYILWTTGPILTQSRGRGQLQSPRPSPLVYVLPVRKA